MQRIVLFYKKNAVNFVVFELWLPSVTTISSKITSFQKILPENLQKVVWRKSLYSRNPICLARACWSDLQ